MSETVESELVFKLALLGDSAVGKTSLINQYIHHKFDHDYHPSLGVNIVIKKMYVKEKNTCIKMILWDIAGQEKYDLSRKAFFQGCVGALFVYDVTRAITFRNIESKWLKDLKAFGNKDAAYLLIGNKNDLIDQKGVTTEDGQQLAEKMEADAFVETSAQSGENVEQAFKTLLLNVIENKS